MKKAGKWLTVTAGVGAVWYLAQAILVRFLGILAFFVAAFEAAVQERAAAEPQASADDADDAPSLPRRLAADRAYRKSLEADSLIDLRDDISIPS